MTSSILCWDEGFGQDANSLTYKALFRNTAHGEKGALIFGDLQFRGRFVEGKRNNGGPALFLNDYDSIVLAYCRFFGSLTWRRSANPFDTSKSSVAILIPWFDMCRFRSSSSVVISGNRFRHSDDDAIALHQAEYVQGAGKIHGKFNRGAQRFRGCLRNTYFGCAHDFGDRKYSTSLQSAWRCNQL